MTSVGRDAAWSVWVVAEDVAGTVTSHRRLMELDEDLLGPGDEPTRDRVLTTSLEMKVRWKLLCSMQSERIAVDGKGAWIELHVMSQAA